MRTNAQLLSRPHVRIFYMIRLDEIFQFLVRGKGVQHIPLVHFRFGVLGRIAESLRPKSPSRITNGFVDGRGQLPDTPTLVIRPSWGLDDERLHSPLFTGTRKKKAGANAS